MSHFEVFEYPNYLILTLHRQPTSVAFQAPVAAEACENPCWGGSPISDRVFGNEVPRLGKQARAHLKGLVGGGRSKKF